MLTAVEALLVSLYGYRPGCQPPPGKLLSRESSPSPPGPMQTDALQLDNESVNKVVTSNEHTGTVLKDALEHSALSTDASLDHRTSNCSSSSSVAEDWIINQFPVGLEANFSLCEDEEAVKEVPERLEDDPLLDADTSTDQLSAEGWSRGTAVIDPVSREPLQPVQIHQPSKSNPSDTNKNPSSSNKKTFNAITEKGTSLTAYNLISNCTMRAPLSPAALFEKEARAEVLREKPTASLKEISIAINSKWKNLREDDRKK